MKDCKDRVSLTEKRANSINEGNRQKTTHPYHVGVGQVVHSSCRNNYTNRKYVQCNS